MNGLANRPNFHDPKPYQEDSDASCQGTGDPQSSSRAWRLGVALCMMSVSLCISAVCVPASRSNAEEPQKPAAAAGETHQRPAFDLSYLPIEAIDSRSTARPAK